MEIKEILESFEEEKKYLLKDISSYKFIMTDILINQLHRIKAVNQIIRELSRVKDNGFIEYYKKEKDEIISEIKNEKTIVSPNFLQQVHRLKTINNVLELVDLDNKIKKRQYIG